MVYYFNMEIKKKVWPAYFQKILDGEKKFEIRLADFECKEGDVLVLEEYDSDKKEYTGRVLKKKVSYVLRTKDLKFWGKEEIEKHGLQVIGF